MNTNGNQVKSGRSKKKGIYRLRVPLQGMWTHDFRESSIPNHRSRHAPRHSTTVVWRRRGKGNRRGANVKKVCGGKFPGLARRPQAQSAKWLATAGNSNTSRNRQHISAQPQIPPIRAALTEKIAVGGHEACEESPAGRHLFHNILYQFECSAGKWADDVLLRR